MHRDRRATIPNTEALERIARSLRDGFDAGDVVLRVLADDSGVLLDDRREQILALNPAGIVLAVAVRDGSVSLDQLADAVQARYSLPRHEAIRDVAGFLTRLAGSAGQVWG